MESGGPAEPHEPSRPADAAQPVVDDVTDPEDRNGFWLPTTRSLIAAYAALNGYFLAVHHAGWNLHFSLIGDSNVSFMPLGWLWPMSSILLFVTAVVIDERRHLMVPMVVLGVAVDTVNSQSSFAQLVEHSMWWSVTLPSFLAPAIAGLLFARWSRGPADPPSVIAEPMRGPAELTRGPAESTRGPKMPSRNDSDPTPTTARSNAGNSTVGGKASRLPTDRQPLKLPTTTFAIVTVFVVQAVSLLSIPVDDGFLLRHPIAWLPFSTADALLYPSLFVAAFTIARARALLLAPALAALPISARLIEWTGDPCATDDGTSTSCTAQILWLTVHQWLPAIVVAITAGLVASRWSRWGQVLPDA